MHMKYRLTGSLIHIYSYIVAVRMKPFIYFQSDILKHNIHCFPFMVSQIEI